MRKPKFIRNIGESQRLTLEAMEAMDDYLRSKGWAITRDAVNIYAEKIVFNLTATLLPPASTTAGVPVISTKAETVPDNDHQQLAE